MPFRARVHGRGHGQSGVPPLSLRPRVRLTRRALEGVLALSLASALAACRVDVGTREVDGSFVDVGGDVSTDILSSDVFAVSCEIVTNVGCARGSEQCVPSAEGGTRCAEAGLGVSGASCSDQSDCATGFLCGVSEGVSRCRQLCLVGNVTCGEGSCETAFEANGRRVGWCPVSESP